MVKIGSASYVVKDTSRVQLEDILVGLNCDGNRSCRDGGHHLRCVVSWDIVESRDGDGVLRGFCGIAGAILSCVWVVCLSSDSPVALDVLEAIVHQTASAPVVSLSIAVYQLLLGKRNDVSPICNLASALS